MRVNRKQFGHGRTGNSSSQVRCWDRILYEVYLSEDFTISEYRRVVKTPLYNNEVDAFNKFGYLKEDKYIYIVQMNAEGNFGELYYKIKSMLLECLREKKLDSLLD